MTGGRYGRVRVLRRFSSVYFAARRRYYALRYRTLELAPDVRIGGTISFEGRPRVRIGAGCRLTKAVRFSGRGSIDVGPDTLLNGPWIGSWTSVTVGSRCLLGQAAIVDTDFHNLQPELRHEPPGPRVTAPIVIGDNVWVGEQVTVLKGVTIGSDSVLGRGTVVRRDVPPRVVVIGNPQQIVKQFDVAEG